MEIFEKIVAARKLRRSDMRNSDTGMTNPDPLETSMVNLEKVGTAAHVSEFSLIYLQA